MTGTDLLSDAPQLAVAGCKDTTQYLLEFLLRHQYRVSLLITLTSEQGEEYQVSGYRDLRCLAAATGIPVYVPATYGLTGERDQFTLTSKRLDVLLVMGWQRLLPDWLLRHLRVGAFGMHGSSEPLPEGRGRSPLNWSIIQGRNSFLTNLFRYDHGIDSGEVVSSQAFDITSFDTAATLHLKNTVAMCQILERMLPSLLAGRVRTVPQAPGPPTYYPKRRSVDGEIFWRDATAEIHRLINAVTKPFPGARTYTSAGKLVKIWRAVPFDTVLQFRAEPGEIVFVCDDGFVVKTGDSALLVQEWEGQVTPELGMIFANLQKYRWDWHKLPMRSAEWCRGYEDIPEEYRRE